MHSHEHHTGNVSILSQIFINFRFADDTFANAEEEEEAGDILTSMDTTCTSYKMEIRPDKTNYDKLSRWLPRRRIQEFLFTNSGPSKGIQR